MTTSARCWRCGSALWLADPPLTSRELSDRLLDRIQAALPEGHGIDRDYLNRVGLVIEEFLAELPRLPAECVGRSAKTEKVPR